MAKKFDYVDDERSIWKFLFLNIITFGIYDFWVAHTLARDINKIYKVEDNRRLPGVVMYTVLSILTLGVYSIFWELKLASMIADEGRRRGIRTEVSPSFIIICYLLTYISGIAKYVAINQVFEAMNKLAADYNREVRRMPSSYFEHPEDIVN